MFGGTDSTKSFRWIQKKEMACNSLNCTPFVNSLLYVCSLRTYLTSSNIKYIDNQLVTVIKIQMICKCKYKTI